MKARLSTLAFFLAIAAAAFVLVYPLYSDFAGHYKTLIEMNGLWVIIPVMVPVVIAVTPVLFRIQMIRIIATVLLGAFAFIGGFTIGFFYLPSAVVMLLAACVDDSAKFRDAVP